MIVVFDKSKPAGRARRAPSIAPDAATLAQAWALKEQCYAAWSSEPQRAARVAASLRALCAGGEAHPGDVAREIEALAQWTEGIAHITRGRMAEAAPCFDAAAAQFRSLGQPANAAQTQVPKIVAMSMLGQYDAAIDCAEQAQREFMALGCSPHKATASAKPR